MATFLRTRGHGEGSGEKHWAWAKYEAEEAHNTPRSPTTAQIEQDLIDALRARAADGLPK